MSIIEAHVEAEVSSYGSTIEEAVRNLSNKVTSLGFGEIFECEVECQERPTGLVGGPIATWVASAYVSCKRQVEV